MPTLDGTIRFINSEHRPCFCKDRKALFHRWEEKAKGITVGGYTIGSKTPKAIQVKQTLAIVEYEDGTVHEAYPDDIRFIDTKELISQIHWEEQKD